MTTANSLQLSFVRESTAGTTPNTPRMRKARITSESLFYAPIFNVSEELRDDRMIGDPTQIMFESGGGVNFEFSYPEDSTWMSEIIRSAMYSTWTNTPTFDNDGTADSVVTDAGTTTDTYVVASGGASVVAGHLVRATGFTNSANNQIFRAVTGSGTTVVGASLSLVAETAPPAAAKLKVVGFRGASGDINATSTGLSSTLLNFTLLGLAVGMWVKIGGTSAPNKFVTAALNDWVRITAITSTTLTFDNRPTGWTTETGTGLLISVWFGDQIKNGTTQTSLTTERGFLRQTTPTYIVNTGMSVGEYMIDMKKRAKITGSATFNGMSGSESVTPLDASPDAVTTNAVFSAHVNVGRLAENGSAMVAPNWASAFTLKINNNQRPIEDVTASAPQGILDGECTVDGTLETYFGSRSILTRFFAGTVTSLNSRVQKDSQAVVFQIPRATLNGGGRPNATGKNTDVMQQFTFSASKDTDTSAHVVIDRLPYYE